MSNSKPNYFQRRTKPQGPRANERIRALDVQVIGSDGSNLGSMPLQKAIEIAKNADLLRNNIKINSDLIRQGLKDTRIPFLENDSHIIPIHLYDPDLCKEAANVLIEEHGVYIQPIFYPTVPKGDERFRVTITPKHSAEDVQTFVNSLDKVWSKLNLKRAKKITSRVSKISNLF